MLFVFDDLFLVLISYFWNLNHSRTILFSRGVAHCCHAKHGLLLCASVVLVLLGVVLPLIGLRFP